jgi:hypothetical protein
MTQAWLFGGNKQLTYVRGLFILVHIQARLLRVWDKGAGGCANSAPILIASDEVKLNLETARQTHATIF